MNAKGGTIRMSDCFGQDEYRPPSASLSGRKCAFNPLSSFASKSDKTTNFLKIK